MATEGLAPLLKSDGSEVISGKYIVVFKESLNDSEVSSTMQTVTDIITTGGGINSITSKYDMGTFRGFAAMLDNETLTKIRALQAVKYVECDSVVSVAK